MIVEERLVEYLGERLRALKQAADGSPYVVTGSAENSQLMKISPKWIKQSAAYAKSGYCSLLAN